MRRLLTQLHPKGATGVYIPDDNESEPQCTWAWDKETGEVRDITEVASIVVDYVPSYGKLDETR